METSLPSTNQNDVCSYIRNTPKYYLKGLLLAMLVAFFNFGPIFGQINPNQSNQIRLEQQATKSAVTPAANHVVVDQVIGNPYINASGLKVNALRATPATNPDLPTDIACGDLKVVLILDESGSISPSQTPGAAAAVRSGALQLAQSLINSGAELRVVEFATTSSVVSLGGATVNSTFITNFNNYFNSSYSGQS